MGKQMKLTGKGRFAIVHGLAGTRVCKAWQGMIDRCTKPKRDDFKWYGGRGIKVCARWRKSLLNFLADMGHPPKGKTLDRIDNNDDYKPSNCQWSTAKEQARNRTSTRFITYQGRTQAMAAWAEETGITNGLLHWRLKAGWLLDRAFRHGQGDK